VRVISQHDVLMARMAAQRLTDDTRCRADPAEVPRAVLGLQAQSMNAARLAMRVRSTGLTESAIDDGFARERTVVRAWLMRGTLHLVAAEDVRWLLKILGSHIDRRDALRRAQVGLDDALCERGIAALRTELAGGPKTGRDLRARLRSRGVAIGTDVQAMIHLLAHAAHRGVICKGPPAGRTDTYVLFEDWVPRMRVPAVRSPLPSWHDAS